MFVIAEQQLTSLIAPITPFYSSQSEWIQLEEGQLTTFSEIYRRQPAVRSVVDFLAGHLSRMPIRLYHRISATDRETLHDHPAQKIVRVPNGYRANTSFWRDVWLDFLLYDRFALVKIKSQDSGNPAALVRVPAVWWTPFGHNYWRPTSLRIIGNRGWDDYPIEDTVYVHGYDPTDPRIGVSPLETLRSMLEEEFAGSQWRKRFWQQGAQPSMVITRPLDAPDWADGARDRFIESLRAAANRGKPLLLEEGMLSNPTAAFDPATAQYVQSKQFTREEVLRAYNLPLGLFDPNEKGDIGQYRSMLYAEALTPLLSRFTDELELQLLTEWFPDPYDAGYYYEAAIEEKMRGNILEQLTMLTSAAGAPILTRDESRGYLNLPSLASQGADELVVPLNVLLGGQPSPQMPLNAGNQNGPAKPPQEYETSGTPPTKAKTSELGSGVVDEDSPSPIVKPDYYPGVVNPPTRPLVFATPKHIIQEHGQYCVYNEDSSRKFGCYDTRAEAEARLAQIEEFKDVPPLWELLGFKSPEAHQAHMIFLKQARVRYSEKATQVIAANFKRQANSHAGGKGFARDRWDKELADDMFAVAVETANYFGKDAAERIHGTYDSDRTLAYLRKNTDIAAKGVNTTTAAQLDAAEDPKTVWEISTSSRAAQIGITRTTQVMNWSIEEAARQNGG